ncbi:polysaccharide deacetylase family protein [Caldisalinibacter kiritimatiensis]|uniref:Putative polysaccharide deacetylase n=1 Tax=Caldisalinibacter kiritimatiensis TaxID=1304284 RepID=R1AS48_9FIRM|nr:polysaccharide deacetylase family protein [Caldisalinibacter kiritimatiensis]EOC99466.1 Putative polysaccharide deacetylase [Caldisalinibacter kiritimatiensis]
MTKIVLIILMIFIMYAIIPNFYSRNISKNVLRRFDNTNYLALTFDDGPDPKYTPELLDLLKKNEVKATFFLVADKAYKNKELVYRMIKEGHEVGLHSLKHKSAWLTTPLQTKYNFDRSIEIFKELGINIKLFRPPWGTFNLFTLYYATKYRLKTIFWTKEAKDWSRKTTVEQIKDRIINNINNGDIIVLHDSNGAEGAPKRTIEAVRDIIPKLKHDGYEFVTISQGMGGVEFEQDSQIYI